MAKYCISCGAALNRGARFCGECGAPVPVDGGVAAAAAPDDAPPALPMPGDAEPELADDATEGNRPNWLLIGGAAAIIALLILYYFIFLRDDLAADPPVQPAPKTAVTPAEQVNLFAVTQANIRDRATTDGTAIIGKAARGEALAGEIITGEDGTTPWLKLADGKGYVATANLSEEERPEIVEPLGDRLWKTDRQMPIFASPDSSSAVLDTASAGLALTLFGLTADDFIEIKLRKGGVGYIADGVRIAKASEAKGPPIAIRFNPASCAFGGELEAEFGKLNAKSRAAYRVIDQTEFASDEARDKALIAFEGKSYFQRLERSFNGLSITGIAQHYESQSLYFADPPDKVIAVFRAAGYKIGRDGQFANTEIYAGIGATAGEGRTFGKTDLNCGV